jgi:hypothetical protein
MGLSEFKLVSVSIYLSIYLSIIYLCLNLIVGKVDWKLKFPSRQNKLYTIFPFLQVNETNLEINPFFDYLVQINIV